MIKGDEKVDIWEGTFEIRIIMPCLSSRQEARTKVVQFCKTVEGFDDTISLSWKSLKFKFGAKEE